jgi:hypothetical protein
MARDATKAEVSYFDNHLPQLEAALFDLLH